MTSNNKKDDDSHRLSLEGSESDSRRGLQLGIPSASLAADAIKTPRTPLMKALSKITMFSPNYPSTIPTPRLIRRNMAYKQSQNVWNVKNKYGKHRMRFLLFLVTNDVFHLMLRWPTYILLSFLIGIWVLFILGFAYIYMLVDQANLHVDCGLDTAGDGTSVPWHTAFAFSLETCTTVGYGLPGSSGAFFENCPYLQTTIFFQMTFSMVFNAVLLSFLFARFSRQERRSTQVVFSDKAIIRKDDRGRFIFEARVYDVDSMYPLIEAHVRMYAVHCSSDRDYSTMRIMHPNDELGGMLCMSIPTTVAHHIDAYSSLFPPHRRPLRHVIDDQGLVLREVDSSTGGRDGVPCPVCGELYGTTNRLKKHILYNQLMESHDDVPVEGSHQELTHDDICRLTEKSAPALTLAEIGKYYELSRIEIVVVVEAINPLTSGTFQALQSYQYDDIVYGGRFAPLYTENNEVDMEQFHVIHRNDTDLENGLEDGNLSRTVDGAKTIG